MKHPRIGVGIIIEKNHKVLLVKRINVHGSGNWSTPGGHLDFFENPEDCAIREAKEETGIDIHNVNFRAFTNDIFVDEEKHYITIWMEGVHFSGEPFINADYEISEVRWFAWDQLPENLFISFRNLIEGKGYS